MVKFLKKFSETIEGAKRHLTMTSKVQAKQTIEMIYATSFYAINGFLTGRPNKPQKLAWRYWVIPGIVTKEGWNKPVQEKAKLILKNTRNGLSENDINYIQYEIKPFYEKSLKEQTNKTIEMLDAIDENKVRDFLLKYKKEKRGQYN